MTTRRFDLAVLGADSAVGGALLDLIGARRFPAGEITALGVDVEEGASVEFAGAALALEEVADFGFSAVQLAFLASDDPRLAAEAERAADAGVVVIDAAGIEWRDSAIPRVVAGLNSEALAGFNARGIVAGPERAAVPLALALHPLRALAPLRRLNVTLVAPVSDAGRPAFEDLARETTALLNARHYERRHFPQQIAFNVHGQLGPAGAGGATEREQRIAADLRGLLDSEALVAAITVLQGGVFFGYGMAVEVEFETTVALEDAAAALRGAAAIEYVDSPDAADCPSPVVDATSTEAVRVARLRPGAGPRALAFWLTADNIRRAAAANAVEMAGILARDYL